MEPMVSPTKVADSVLRNRGIFAVPQGECLQAEDCRDSLREEVNFYARVEDLPEFQSILEKVPVSVTLRTAKQRDTAPTSANDLLRELRRGPACCGLMSIWSRSFRISLLIGIVVSLARF